MAKKKTKKNVEEQKPYEPYSNMGARKVVLFIGFAMSIIGFLVVLVGALFFFLPQLNVVEGVSPAKLLTAIFGLGVAVCFVSTVFSVAGANCKKIVARFSFLFDILAFVIGAALLIIVLFLRTLIPIPALEAIA